MVEGEELLHQQQLQVDLAEEVELEGHLKLQLRELKE